MTARRTQPGSNSEAPVGQYQDKRLDILPDSRDISQTYGPMPMTLGVKKFTARPAVGPVHELLSDAEMAMPFHEDNPIDIGPNHMFEPVRQPASSQSFDRSPHDGMTVSGANSIISRDQSGTPGQGMSGLYYGSQGDGEREASEGVENLSISRSRSMTGPAEDIKTPALANLDSSGKASGQASSIARPDSGEPAPSWTELRTKAGKERKRLPLACIACRRKKIRCSGEKPTCKHCIRSRIPCVYKVAARKAAPRTDYMGMLDRRLKRMEERIIKLIPKEKLGTVSVTGRATLKPASQDVRGKGSGVKKRVADEAFAADFDEWAGRKDAVPAARGHPLKRTDTEESKLLVEGSDYLPSTELQLHLAEVFFDYVYGQSYLLLHKPSFMRRLRAGTVPPVLMLAVCAISARFSSHPQVATEPKYLRGERWASAARDIALKRYDTPNLTVLTVYLILGLHEFGTCHGGRSWMFGGMAQRMAYALQLHKEVDHRSPTKDPHDATRLSPTDREIRRRIMWACFMMDRFNSSGTDRPMFAFEQYIKIQLPVKEQYFQMELPGPTEDLEGRLLYSAVSHEGRVIDPKENMGVAAYMIRSIAIWGRLVQYMNLGGKENDEYPMWSPHSEFQKLRAQVENFITTRPASLQYNNDNLRTHAAERLANQFLFFHIICQQIVLFLYRFSLPSIANAMPPKDTPPDFLANAAQAALEAANFISHLIHESLNYNVVAPFAGYAAFFSSIVHIHGVFSKNPRMERSSKQNLAYNLTFLGKMKSYWAMFHFMGENLRDLYRHHSDAARRGLDVLEPRKGDSAVVEYGDWFDKYPHGVSGAEDDPAIEMLQEAETRAALSQSPNLQTVEEFFSSLSPPSRKQKESAQAKKSKRVKSPQQKKDQSGPVHEHSMDRHVSDRVQAITAQPTSANQAPLMPAEAVIPPVHAQTYPQPPYPPQQTFTTDVNAHMQPLQSDLVTEQTLGGGYSQDGPSVPLPIAVDVPAQSNPEIKAENASSWNFDFGRMNNNLLPDPTSVWFMPFNVNPPEYRDDAGFVHPGSALSGYQWSPAQPLHLQPIDVPNAGVSAGMEINTVAEALDPGQSTTEGTSAGQLQFGDGTLII